MHFNDGADEKGGKREALIDLVTMLCNLRYLFNTIRIRFEYFEEVVQFVDNVDFLERQLTNPSSAVQKMYRKRSNK